MLIAEGVVTSLVGFLALLIERQGHAGIAVQEYVVVHLLLHLQRGLLARQSVAIEDFVDCLACDTHGILQTARVVVKDYSAGTVGTIDFHEHVLLVLATFTVEVEQLLEVGVQVVLAAVDESFGSVDAHLQVTLGIAAQAVILRIGAFVEADAYQHSSGSTL